MNYGIRYTMCMGRNMVLTNKEKFFETAKKREQFVEKLEKDGKFIEISAWSDPPSVEARERERQDAIIRANGTMTPEDLERELTDAGYDSLPGAAEDRRTSEAAAARRNFGNQGTNEDGYGF